MQDRNDSTDKKDDEAENASAVSITHQPQHLLAASLQDIPRDLQFVADGPSGYEHHVFISHRGTQKKEVAFPIMVIFSYFCGPHFAVFDEATFQLGESNHTVISKALSKCAHCLVLVSQDFFQSKWTVAEADAFLKESEKVDAQGQRKVISFFIGLSPGECRSLKSNFCHEENEPLLDETISYRQRIAKKLGTLNGREQVKDRVLGNESIREFILKQMPDLLENELRFENGTRPALLPEFHNRVDPVLLAYVYDGAVRYYEKAKGKVNASSLGVLIRELKENAPEDCQRAERFVFKHRVSGEGTAHGAHAEYLADDLPSDTSPETLLQLQRQKMQWLSSSGKTFSVEHYLDNKRPIGNVSTSVLATRARDKAILVSPALEKNEASEAAAVPMDLADSKESDATHGHGVSDGLPFLEDPSRGPSSAPCIAWYFSEGARLKMFQLRVENKTWQMDFENLRLPVFSPLLQQGSILASHQSAHEILCQYLVPVKRDEAGRIVLISGLAGLGKSRLVQHYLYQQDKAPSEDRHAMVAWLSGQTEEAFEAQWNALADQFRAIDSMLNEIDDSTVIQHWFEKQQSQWLLIIDDWQFLDVEKILKKLPSKGGHVVVTTRHPVTYFDHSEMRSQGRILSGLKLELLSVEESKQLIEAHFGVHWNVLGHKEENKALNTLVTTIGGFPQGLVQAATYIRKKSISFSRYVMHLTHSPELQWRLLSDTVLDTFKPKETMAYQWGNSKQLLLQRLYQIFPDVSQVLHEEIFIAWLAELASFMPSSFHQQEEEKSSGNDTKVFSPGFLRQQWQAMIIAKFPALREMVNVDELWTVYKAGLSDYFPLHFVALEGQSILVSPVVHHLLLKGLPIPRVDPFETNLAFSPFRETSKQAGKGEEGQERDEEKKEEKEDEKKSDVPFSHSAFFGKNARLGHLRSDLLVLGSPDALRAWKLPTENVDFIPRPYATNDLAKKLAAVYSADQDTRQVVLTTAVSGMGGVGKTELARHYVHHSKHNENEALNRDYQRRFWFDASSLSQLSISFRELGLALQLIEPKDDDIEVQKRIHKWLQLHPGWLVVFDNADDYQAIAEWVPAKGGTVLITTREHAPGQLPDEQIVRMTALEEREAVQWLCQLSHREEFTLSVEEKSAAAELVQSLGYLPLAIVQVAAYLRTHPDVLIAGYFEKFTSDAIGTLNDLHVTQVENKEEAHASHDSDARSRHIIARTWHISLEAIAATAKKKGSRPTMAQPLLTFCSYLASAAIPVPVLESWLTEQLHDSSIDNDKTYLNYVLDDYLSELLRYSLVQRDPYVNTIAVHRLVQEVMRFEDKVILTSQEIFDKRLRSLAKILESLYFYNKKAENYPKAILLIPHLMAVSGQLSPFLTHASSADGNNKGTADDLQGCLLTTMGDFHYDVSGDVRKAVDYFSQVLVIDLQIHGDAYVHTDVAKSYNNLGEAYRTLGDAQKALAYHEKALKIWIQVYGYANSFVAASYNNAGSAYLSLGAAKKALAYHEKALAIYLQVHGDVHSDVAASYCNLGNAYKQLDDTQTALVYHEKALTIFLQVYGDTHSNVAKIYNNLGETYRILGDFQKALAHCEKTLTIRLQVHGNSHPQVAASYNNVGLIYASLGDIQKALAYYEKALAIFFQVYGDDVHPNVATIYNSLGEAYRTLDDTQKALAYHEKALTIRLQVYSGTHSDVAMSYNNLGLTYDSLGDVQKALTYHENALTIRLQVHSDTHSDVAASYANLGNAYNILCDSQKALVYYEKALAIFLQAYGDAHFNVATIYNSLGETYRTLGDTQQALAYHKKALTIQLQVHGDIHSDVAMSYNNLGLIYDSLGDAKKALTYHEKALAIFLQVYGDTHSGVAASYNNLGLIYVSLGDIQKALFYHEKALAIQLQIHSNACSHVATSYEHLGNAYYRLGDAQKALTYYEKTLTIRMQVYGDAHPHVAISYNNLGVTYASLGDVQKALIYHEKALIVRLQVHGDVHSDVAASYNNLGDVYDSLGDAQKAFVSYEKALAIYLQIHSDTHPAVAVTYNNLGEAYRTLGDAQKALAYHEKALTIRLQIYGNTHPNVAISYNNLGLTHNSLGNTQNALVFHEQALMIFLQVHGDAHPHVAISYYNLGLAYDSLGDNQKALEYHEKALTINIQIHGDAYQNSQIHFRLATDYLQKNNSDKAIEHYIKSIQSKQNPLSLEQKQSLYHNLACCYHVKGQIEEAEQSFLQSLRQKPMMGTYCDYSLLLIRQSRFLEAIPLLKQVIEKKDNGSGLYYGLLEKRLFDEYLQLEIAEEKGLSIKPILIAYYWLIRCYQKLEQPDQVQTCLALFTEFVEEERSPLSYQLLLYTHQFLGNAEKVEICKMILEVLAEQDSSGNKPEIAEGVVSQEASLNDVVVMVATAVEEEKQISQLPLNKEAVSAVTRLSSPFALANETTQDRQKDILQARIRTLKTAGKIVPTQVMVVPSHAEEIAKREPSSYPRMFSNASDEQILQRFQIILENFNNGEIEENAMRHAICIALESFKNRSSGYSLNSNRMFRIILKILQPEKMALKASEDIVQRIVLGEIPELEKEKIKKRVADSEFYAVFFQEIANSLGIKSFLSEENKEAAKRRVRNWRSIVQA